MTDYAHVTVDGQIDREGLPSVDYLPDGRAVSGFDKLDAETLAGAGWLPVTEPAPPEYDPATHQAIRGLELVDGAVVASWRIEPRPADPDELLETELRNARADVDAATTVAGLRAATLRAIDALTGAGGTAAARGRPVPPATP